MIGRGPLRLSHLLSIGAMTSSLVLAGFLAHPRPAYAGTDANFPVTHVVTLQRGATTETLASSALTVADFLREKNIVVGVNDFVSPASETPLSDHLAIVYRAAVPVMITQGRVQKTISTSADTVQAALAQAGVALSNGDTISAPLSAPIHARETLHVSHLNVWQRVETRAIPTRTIARLDERLAPGATHIVSSGISGARRITVQFAQRDGGTIVAHVLRSETTRASRPRIVLLGRDEYDAFLMAAQSGLTSALQSRDRLSMVATAYTAGCSGCSGYTAIGRRAGHGIVAVDPSFIPLGTRLYISGYGYAIAGDTGGAIHGNRIDLGFDSLRDALEFGRREVTVYRLQ